MGADDAGRILEYKCRVEGTIPWMDIEMDEVRSERRICEVGRGGEGERKTMRDGERGRGEGKEWKRGTGGGYKGGRANKGERNGRGGGG